MEYEIPMEDITNSSMITAMGYDPYNLRAKVRFKNGGEYLVLGLKGDAYDLWRNHPIEGSVGKHYHHEIRPHYSIEKVA